MIIVSETAATQIKRCSQTNDQPACCVVWVHKTPKRGRNADLPMVSDHRLYNTKLLRQGQNRHAATTQNQTDHEDRHLAMGRGRFSDHHRDQRESKKLSQPLASVCRQNGSRKITLDFRTPLKHRQISSKLLLNRMLHLQSRMLKNRHQLHEGNQAKTHQRKSRQRQRYWSLFANKTTRQRQDGGSNRTCQQHKSGMWNSSAEDPGDHR